MIDDPNGVLALFLRGTGMGAGLGTTFLIVKLFFGRIDKKEAHVDAANNTLIQHLLERLETMNKRIVDLEGELDECRKRDAEKEARLARLEATQLGLGDARQHAALIVASEKAETKEA